MVEVILRESESTSALIEQLLTLARADAESETLSMQTLDLRTVLNDLDAESRTLAETRGLSYRMQLPEKPVAVLGDRPYLRRLLLLLVQNACRYTGPGGSVGLRLRVQDGTAVIEVTDTGIGIAVEELPHVFERFYRAANARFFHPEGTGLGLCIAQWIANAHGGTLTAASTPGAGTCMSVRLDAIAP